MYPRGSKSWDYQEWLLDLAHQYSVLPPSIVINNSVGDGKIPAKKVKAKPNIIIFLFYLDWDDQPRNHVMICQLT